MKLSILTGTEPALYALLAPFAMDRAIVRELGAPVYTSPGHRWVVARGDDELLLGWAGVDLTRDGIAVLDWSYVLPEHRQRGVFASLTRVRLDLSMGRTTTASTAKSYLVAWYQRAGFAVTRQNGSWTYLRREPV